MPMKSRSRSYRPKQDTAPPSTPEDGAKRLAALIPQVFDRKDGSGADWPLVAESLFRSAFATLDRLPPDERRKLATRVHEGAYHRMTGDAEAMNREALEAAATVKAALSAAFSTPTPKGPR